MTLLQVKQEKASTPAATLAKFASLKINTAACGRYVLLRTERYLPQENCFNSKQFCARSLPLKVCSLTAQLGSCIHLKDHIPFTMPLCHAQGSCSSTATIFQGHISKSPLSLAFGSSISGCPETQTSNSHRVSTLPR